MTVYELVRELQALPNQGVRVCLAVDLSDDDAFGPDWMEVDIDDVRSEGPFALIRLKWL